jgi:hypothetical protein
MASVEFVRAASDLLIPSSGNVRFAWFNARQQQRRETGALDSRPSQQLLCEDFRVPVNHSFSAKEPSEIYPQFGASRHRGSQKSPRLTLAHSEAGGNGRTLASAADDQLRCKRSELPLSPVCSKHRYTARARAGRHDNDKRRPEAAQSRRYRLIKLWYGSSVSAANALK